MRKNINTPEYWDAFYKQERFAKRHCWKIAPYIKIRKILEKRYRKYSRYNIYDLGCAFGDGLAYIAESSAMSRCKFTGVDYSVECIKWAIEKYKDIEFKIGDIEKIEVKVDMILLVETLEHIEEDMALLERLRNMCRTLVISVPNSEDPGNLIDEHLHSYTPDSFPGAEVYVDKETIIAIYG